jgi:hypothetical protein
VKIITVTFAIAFMFLASANAQEEEKTITLNGYVSTLQSSMFEKLSGDFINDNLIHNRLNFKGYLNSNLTFAAEIRNRLFIGDMIRFNPAYPSFIGDDQGLVDMSWNMFSEKSFFMNTTVDRLWFDMNYGKFQARIGRQRINWGQTLIWNPNDIFNAYSYFDFDYVERPGSDAVRLQYYPGSSSAIELAVKANNDNEITAAALYRFNKWSYDIQFLAGVMDNDQLVGGLGWSGAIGSVSFRGEGTWFQPSKNMNDTTGTGILTAGIDKVFGDNSMIQAQVMVCNRPLNFSNFTSLYSKSMTVKDLAFSKFSAFASYSYPVTPLFTLSLSSMWFPDLKGYFTGFSADYSAAENVDCSLLWQHFDGNFGNNRTKLNLAFLRIKFSF